MDAASVKNIVHNFNQYIDDYFSDSHPGTARKMTYYFIVIPALAIVGRICGYFVEGSLGLYGRAKNYLSNEAQSKTADKVHKTINLLTDPLQEMEDIASSTNSVSKKSIKLPTGLENIVDVYKKTEFKPVSNLTIRDLSKESKTAENVKSELLKNNVPYSPQLVREGNSYTFLYLNIFGHVIEKHYDYERSKGNIVDRDAPDSSGLTKPIQEECLNIINLDIDSINKRLRENPARMAEKLPKKIKDNNENWQPLESPNYPDLALAVLFEGSTEAEFYTLKFLPEESSKGTQPIYQLGNESDAFKGSLQDLQDNDKAWRMKRLIKG